MPRAARAACSSPDEGRGPEELDADWQRWRDFFEFVAAQPDGAFWIAEDGDEIVGYTRMSSFGSMDELTELWVEPSHAGRGIGHALLERVWPESPTLERGRVVVTLGTPVDLSLYTEFGVMPVSGHWDLRHRVDQYLERRAHEVDAAVPSVHGLTANRAVEEWKRLEPAAIGHERPLLHEFLGRTRTSLALLDRDSGRARALCWVSSDGDIGPAVAESPEDLVPVVLAALDNVAKAQAPETLGVFCTTDSWWLLDRLRTARLPRALAVLGDVVGPAAGARPLCADGAAQAPVSALPNSGVWVKPFPTSLARRSPSRCSWWLPTSSSRSCSERYSGSPGWCSRSWRS